MLSTELTVAVLAQKPATQRLDFIDAVRGCACLWVLLHHSSGLRGGSLHTHNPILGAFMAFLDIGWLGVNLFVVLSGFCLFYPLIRKNPVDRVQLDFRSFAKRRLHRILPPYYAALIIGMAITAWGAPRLMFTEPGFIPNFASHLTMLYNLSPSTVMKFNGSFWSLALETQLYFLFPLLVWFGRKRGLPAVLLGAFLVSLAWQIGVYLRVGSHPSFELGAVTYDALPGRFFEFSCGMAAAFLVARPVSNQFRNAALTILALLVPALVLVLKFGRFMPFTDQIWGVIFACAIVCMQRIPDRAFQGARPFRFLAWFGIISYSVYLVHQPIIDFLPASVFHLTQAHRLAYTLFGIGRMVVLVGFGYLFFLIVERPFLNSRKAAKSGSAPQTA